MITCNNMQTFGNSSTCFGLFRQRKIELWPEDVRKRPQHVGELPYVCILLYLFIGQLLIHTNFGFETWSLILSVERRLKVFENTVLRRIFGRKRDEVTEEWKKKHNGSLMIYTPHQILFG
jgi:hypothetical protein